LVFDGQNPLFYVNGVEQPGLDQVKMNAVNTRDSTVRLNARPLGSEFGAKGLIDDVRVYRRALSTAEIEGLYGRPLDQVVTPPGTPPNAEMSSDDFCDGANKFAVEFVMVGNPGNAGFSHPDLPWEYSGVNGSVPYTFRIGAFEVSAEQVARAKRADRTGLLKFVSAGPWRGPQPVADAQWYEAAIFANWMNVSKGHKPAYRIIRNKSSFEPAVWPLEDSWTLGETNRLRHKDAVYFIPNENEWFKAAYHDNTGTNGEYYSYATGGDKWTTGVDPYLPGNPPTAVIASTLPQTAVFENWLTEVFPSQPAPIHFSGGHSSYGTRGQNGNVWEWCENANLDVREGFVDNPNHWGVLRGGSYQSDAVWLTLATDFDGVTRYDEVGTNGATVGFRVASAAAKPQTVNFNMPSQLQVGRTHVLKATASSGLPVLFAIVGGDPKVASLVKTKSGRNPVWALKILREGIVSVAAMQGGNAAWLPAEASMVFTAAR